MATNGDDSSRLLGEAELQDRRVSLLAKRARDLGIANPPDVPLIRWIGPEQWAAVYATCLRSAGFPAVEKGGSIEYGRVGVPESRAAAFNEALYRCEAQYSIHPQYQLPLSAAAFRRLYDWYVNESVPCLRRNGVSVPEPPSREVWVSEMQRGSVAGAADSPWQPFSSIPPKAREEVRKKCPQLPPWELIIEHPPIIEGLHG
jgi:hypothetical protein